MCWAQSNFGPTLLVSNPTYHHRSSCPAPSRLLKHTKKPSRGSRLTSDALSHHSHQCRVDLDRTTRDVDASPQRTFTSEDGNGPTVSHKGELRHLFPLFFPSCHRAVSTFSQPPVTWVQALSLFYWLPRLTWGLAWWQGILPSAVNCFEPSDTTQYSRPTSYPFWTAVSPVRYLRACYPEVLWTNPREPKRLKTLARGRDGGVSELRRSGTNALNSCFWYHQFAVGYDGVHLPIS